MSELSKYSPELKEIIEQPQSKTGVFVFCFLFSFLAILLFLGFFIESPDIVIAEAKISSSKPPITLKPKVVGRIHIVTDTIPTQTISGEYLAVVENAAEFGDVLTLKAAVETGLPIRTGFSIPNDFELQLGELSSYYYALKNALIKHNQLNNNENEYHRKIAHYSQRLDHEIKELAFIEASFNNSIQQYEIKQKQHKEDSLLFLKNAITESQFQESRLNILNSQKYLISGEENIISKQKSIDDNQNQIKILRAEYAEMLANSQADVETKYKELLAQIRVWEDRYVLLSPSNCLIEWANIIAEGDYVELGEPIFNCIFPNNRPYAVAVLPGQMSGKVKVGQTVNIKLDSYPYTEFGVIKGVVDRISMNSIERGYLLYISLPDGLMSTTGQELSFAETIYGQAEIITEQRRLITRIYHHIYDIISSRRNIEFNETKNIQTVEGIKF